MSSLTKHHVVGCQIYSKIAEIIPTNEIYLWNETAALQIHNVLSFLFIFLCWFRLWFANADQGVFIICSDVENKGLPCFQPSFVGEFSIHIEKELILKYFFKDGHLFFDINVELFIC